MLRSVEQVFGLFGVGATDATTADLIYRLVQLAAQHDEGRKTEHGGHWQPAGR